MLGGSSILSCVSVTVSFFVSMCIYVIAFVRSYEVRLNDINQMVIDKDIKRIDYKLKLTQIVQYHIEIYE